MKRSRPTSEYVCPGDFLQNWNYEVFHAVKLPKSADTGVTGKDGKYVKGEEDDLTAEKTLEEISRLMGVSDETIRELDEVCGKHTLLSGNEPRNARDLLDFPSVPPGIDLECVKNQADQCMRRRQDRSYKIACHRHMKYNVMDDYMTIMPESVVAPAPEPYQVQLPNVVITVQITKCFQHGQMPKKFREMETFLVLGTQPLSDLRDKIKCSADSSIAGDYSIYPGVDPHTLECSGDLYKSSCFFIEDVFYNDQRSNDHKDYSKVIIKWAETEMPDKKFTTCQMDKVNFNNLKIRLGAHYLFLHQGNCEHSVMFTDIRLHNSEDAQDIRQYPILFCTRIKNRTVCQACCKFSARWIVKGSSLTPTEPGYLCKLCFIKLEYNKNGERLSNFKAYHLTDFFSREPEIKMSNEEVERE